MVVCWILTPVGGAVIGYILYRITDYFVRRYIHSARAFQLFLKVALIISGCYGSYALGANNVANTTGVYVGAGLLSPQTGALWGGLAIALGAVTYSKKVMHTVGNRITLIGPEGAVIATLAHSLTVHLYTQIGIPVSSSQAIVGSVIGIGLVRGIKAVNKQTIIKIIAGWFFTPLSAGALSWLAVILLH
jgi:PiT family inorganic phosphate transporter